MPSVWQRLADIVGSAEERTGVAGSLANSFDLDNWLPGGKDAAFTLALIALSAKMAVADGVATASETARLQANRRNSVRPSSTQVDQRLRSRQAGRRRLRGLCQQDRPLLRPRARTRWSTCSTACSSSPSADGMVHEAELDYLKHVSDIFGFDDARFEQIASQHVYLDQGIDPYVVLGLMPGADRDEVKRVYRTLVAEHHPDRLIAKGVPEELIDVATARMQAINQAYNQILKLPPPRSAA